MPFAWAMRAMSGASVVVSSFSVMPQMAANCGHSVMFVRLLMVEKMLSCENFVMPVMKQNFRCGSSSFSRW